jgi:HK97 family phage prohead protease
MTLEYKLLTPNFKVSAEGTGSIKGYASTFGNWDEVRERPVKGAFAPHLTDFLKDGFIAVGHDWSALPVATPSIAHEDDIGLYLEADFHSTPMAQEARTVTTERLARGKSVKLSIGYEVLDDEYVEEGRLLKNIKLYEVSLVTVPANPLASVTGAKGVPLANHSDAVLAAVDELKARMSSLKDLRMKEGRVLSDANRKRIGSLKEALAAVLSDLDELLTMTQPNTEKTRAVLIEALRLQAHLNGVPTL